ncbi:ORF498 protein [Gallid alphaherpesvirus 3]|uniref:DNA polymerase n=1 Tax=Gallid alphaherpesvirus 3 TaxID=35250 RepID=F8TC95_9ALPH|nr:DNA polymerase [Gallid alphaherpesvirus 3]YP_010795697.1 ORF498 protein [Gallid alphaherpesvirus 3]AEI00286.1 DNA polymerase [Gallid alphaherpesvirus 3]AEI00306.1 ORF498 protein [Gallid alphaherpesvirus 3]QEY02317.1 DNA polymerase [Gallid alphaherpesvirus 3]QEY02318.1 ORF498 protein [Gallid alphaherpesvirus 3]
MRAVGGFGGTETRIRTLRNGTLNAERGSCAGKAARDGSRAGRGFRPWRDGLPTGRRGHGHARCIQAHVLVRISRGGGWLRRKSAVVG